jgi:hypothetical protein
MLREYYAEENPYTVFTRYNAGTVIGEIKDWYTTKHRKESEETQAAKKLLECNGYKVS